MKPKLLYLIGPNFCVQALSEPLLSGLSNYYEILVVAEGPEIIRDHYKFESIPFARAPSIFIDILTLINVVKLILRFRPDLFIYSTPKVSFIGSIVAALTRVRSIYIHRGAVYATFSGLKYHFYRLIDTLVMLLSNHTIFISKSLRDYVQSAVSIKIPEYSRKYNSAKGVDLKTFKPKQNTQNHDSYIFGFCGRFNKDKGLEDLLNVTNQLDIDGVRFIFKGRDETNGWFVSQCLKNGKIELEEWDDNVAQFYERIDCLLFPSKREGFGNVCMEAAAKNIPVVAYDIPGVIDAVRNGISGYLIDSSAHFGNTVKQFFYSGDLKVLGDGPRRYAEDSFDQDLILKELVGIINNAFNNKLHS